MIINHIIYKKILIKELKADSSEIEHVIALTCHLQHEMSHQQNMLQVEFWLASSWHIAIFLEPFRPVNQKNNQEV